VWQHIVFQTMIRNVLLTLIWYLSSFFGPIRANPVHHSHNRSSNIWRKCSLKTLILQGKKWHFWPFQYCSGDMISRHFILPVTLNMSLFINNTLDASCPEVHIALQLQSNCYPIQRRYPSQNLVTRAILAATSYSWHKQCTIITQELINFQPLFGYLLID
jgi:hypothetical protein